MTDKSKQRRKALARELNVSHESAANVLRDRLRPVVNASEREVEHKLESAAAIHGARVYTKVRFADVANIASSGLTDDDYRYALQCHLDFLVTDENRHAIFAVEFDGGGHDAKRDSLKNALCEKFDLPLARIDHRHLKIEARGLDALDWLTEVQFLFLPMEEAQASGTIPFDEPLDPLLIYSWGRRSGAFPSPSRWRTETEHSAGRIPVPRCFQVAVQASSEGWATAMATLRVGNDEFLAVREKSTFVASGSARARPRWSSQWRAWTDSSRSTWRAEPAGSPRRVSMNGSPPSSGRVLRGRRARRRTRTTSSSCSRPSTACPVA